MICSSVAFTNILTLWIYEINIDTIYIHSKYTNQENEFHFKKSHRFVVSKFVKLSNELIQSMFFTIHRWLFGDPNFMCIELSFDASISSLHGRKLKRSSSPPNSTFVIIVFVALSSSWRMNICTLSILMSWSEFSPKSLGYLKFWEPHTWKSRKSGFFLSNYKYYLKF